MQSTINHLKTTAMPIKKYSFYRNGDLVYITYTKQSSDAYEADLIKRGLQYELKITDIN